MSRGRSLLLLLHPTTCPLPSALLLPRASLPLLLLPCLLPLLLVLLLLPSGASAAVEPIYWNASNPQFQTDGGIVVFPRMGDRLDIICPHSPAAASALSSSAAAGSRIPQSSPKKSSSSSSAGSSSARLSSLSTSSSAKRSAAAAIQSQRSASSSAVSSSLSSPPDVNGELNRHTSNDDNNNNNNDNDDNKRTTTDENGPAGEVSNGEAGGGVGAGERYRLYMVSREAAAACDARPARNPLLTCDRPGVELKYTVKFQEYSPSVLGLEFRSGRDYYIISTSTGTPEGLDQLQGGACETLRMKVVLHVGQDPDRSPSRRGEVGGEGGPSGGGHWGAPWDRDRTRAARPEHTELSGETDGAKESLPERRHSLLSGSGLALIVGAASGILIIFLLVLLSLVACRLRRQRRHQHHHQQHHQQQQQQQQHPHHHHQHHQQVTCGNNSSGGFAIPNSGVGGYQQQQQFRQLLNHQQHHQHHQQLSHGSGISISADAMLTRRDYAHARTRLSSPLVSPGVGGPGGAGGGPLPSAPPFVKEGGLVGGMAGVSAGPGGLSGDLALGLLQCPHYEKVSGERGHPVYIVQEGGAVTQQAPTAGSPHSPAGVYYRV